MLRKNGAGCSITWSVGVDNLISRIGSGVYAAVTRVVFNIFNLILAPILVFFMLYYKRDILTGMTSWLPARTA